MAQFDRLRQHPVQGQEHRHLYQQREAAADRIDLLLLVQLHHRLLELLAIVAVALLELRHPRLELAHLRHRLVLRRRQRIHQQLDHQHQPYDRPAPVAEQVVQVLQHPEQPAGQRGHDAEAAEVDRPLQPRHLLGLDLADQLRAHPQPCLGGGRTSRWRLQARTQRTDQVMAATVVARGGQGECGGVAGLWDPGTEEVMLEERDPAAGDLPVERAVLDELVIRATLVLLTGAVPRRALETVLLDAHRSRLLQRPRHAAELAVDETLPRLIAAVDHLVAHLHHVLAAVEGERPADADAFVAGPAERDHHLLFARIQFEVRARGDRFAIQHEAVLVGGCAPAVADPSALGDEVVVGILCEQPDRRAVLVGRARIAQKIGATDLASVQHHAQHVGDDRHCLGRRGCRLRRTTGRHPGRGSRHDRCRGNLSVQRRIQVGDAAFATRRDGRRRRGHGLLVPLHPEEGRHHHPGEKKE